MNIYHFLIIQALFSVALAWSCFCRLVRTDDQTIREIRLAIWLEGVAAMLLLVAPFLPLLPRQDFNWPAFTTPEWAWLFLLIAATLVQVATAKHWKHGVPTPFLKAST